MQQPNSFAWWLGGFTQFKAALLPVSAPQCEGAPQCRRVKVLQKPVSAPQCEGAPQCRRVKVLQMPCWSTLNRVEPVPSCSTHGRQASHAANVMVHVPGALSSRGICPAWLLPHIQTLPGSMQRPAPMTSCGSGNHAALHPVQPTV
eukprot:350545-Chlamydomonas_euryale.AAC.3